MRRLSFLERCKRDESRETWAGLNNFDAVYAKVQYRF